MTVETWTTFTTARKSGQRVGGRTLPSLEHFSTHGQHQSAKSLHRRWKHEIQIALLARAVLPTSLRGRSGPPQASLTEPCTLAALDGGSRVHDLDFDGCHFDTALPDDDDDVVSFESFLQESV